MRLSRPPFEQVDPAEFDPLDAAYYASGDPHALWAHLRENAPAIRYDPGDGREPFWVVTRYAEVSRVLRDYRYFTSRRGTMLCIIDLSMPDIASDQMMPDTDPPRHRQLREPVNRALTPHAIKAQEGPMRERVRALLRPALDGGVFDIAAEARMFPMAFTGSLIGLPAEHWPRMSELTTMTVAYSDPDFSAGDPKATLRQAHHELFQFFRDEVRERRRRADPGDGLLGILLSMETEDGRLTDEQVVLNCYALLLGANVTTPHVVATIAATMAEYPDQYRRVRDDPGLRFTCVEEALRWSSPISHFMRYAARDVELNGQHIAEGEPVTVWLGSANRDDRAFADPFRFDVTRQANRQVAFGVGPHFCIGAGLARLGLRVFLDELLDVVEHVELAGEPRHLESNFVAGFKGMPVRCTPRAGVTDAALARGATG